ncbi:gastrula zinc finger protein XlCGF66.1-like [Hyperolius riggenbachi]|uniref:gastrula zinc finger protein XlCGF66.1-like n=1 Tax=Hyperolius riggenbachi TaxID=752182 RepID=UPI0035A3D0A8
MTLSLITEEEPTHMTERILNLTLEIIYLLTGEICFHVKPGGHVTITVPPPLSLISERHNRQKILEVTMKMTELLMEEVPIRYQGVTNYFSMEEWQYIEEHKDLYKDIMMENQPPFTSTADGHNVRNPSEEHLIPSPDNAAEDNDITQFSPGDLKTETGNVDGTGHSANISRDSRNPEEFSDQSHAVTPRSHSTD